MGDDGSNTLSGNAYTNMISGGAGNDKLYAGGLANPVSWINGYQYGGYQSSEYYGADTLDGGEGDDSLYGGTGAEMFAGGAGNDYVWASDGNDTLIGGVGDDSLSGGYGQDVYLYALGDGNDVVNTYSYYNGDILRFDSTVSAGSVGVARVGDDMVLAIGENGSVKLAGWYSTQSHQFTVEFSDGSVWAAPDLEARAALSTNQAPVVAPAIAPQTILEDQAYSFSVRSAFIDPDGDSLTFSAELVEGSMLPSWLTLDPVSGTFYGTPANGDVGVLNVRVAATDTGGLSVSDVVDLTVVNVNDAPVVLNPIADQQANKGSPFSYIIPVNAFADVDVGDALTYSATLSDGSPLPNWLGFDAATKTFSGTPGDGDVGSLSIQVAATDLVGATVFDTFGLEVANSNTAPTVATPIADQSTAEDSLWSFEMPAEAFTDIDAGDVLSYSASLSDGSGLPGWLSFNPATRTFSGIPTNSDVGAIDLRVTATDSGNASVSDVFRVTVNNVNDAPVVSIALADQAANEDAAFSFQLPAGTFADVDVGDALTLSATLSDGSELSGWLSFNGTTGTFSGTPLNADVGAIDVRVTATDGNLASASDIFRITVNNTNDAPSVSTPIADQMTAEDAAFTFIVPADAFGDVDVGDSLSYGATLADGTALPSWLSFNAATRTFSGTPDNSDVGVLQVKVAATDLALASASDEFDLTVTNVNDAPILTGPLADQIANTGTAFSLIVADDAFLDIDPGDTLSYSATLADGSALPAWLSFDAATLRFGGVPGTGDIGNIDIRLTATDGSNASASDIFRITVSSGNQAPVVANPIADQNADEGIHFSYAIAANTFADADIADVLTYSVTANGSALPSWLNFDPTSRTLSGTPQDGTAGAYLLRVTATDTGGASAFDDFVLTIADTLSTVQNGTSGANILNGTNFKDTLNGLGGNDTLYGFAGDDWLDGGSGSDKMVGGLGDDTYVISTSTDVVTENTDEGIDTVRSSISYTLGANVEVLTLTGAGNASATGNALDNLLTGNTASNTLTGNAGNDIVQGLSGNDKLMDSAGNNVLDGGVGTDTLTGATGNELFIGGRGNDNLTTGTGYDIIAFNRGDGADTVVASTGADNILSLGGGIRNQDLAFRKSSKNLILDTGNGESITFQNWYSSTGNRSVLTLQMIEEAAADFAPGGGDLLRDNKVERFNFAALATQFDQVLAANPSLTSWALSDALLTFHLGGSDTAAIGGDLAYQYGKNGTLANVGLAAAQSVLADTQFGQGAQAINQPGLADGLVKLSA